MSRRRHTRPRRRRDLAEAYVIAQREATSLRATVRLDSYEIDRLMDVIAQLHVEVQRLSTQLSGVRAEIATIRRIGQTDPLVQILAAQASELREQLTASRLAVATMTTVPLAGAASLVEHPSSYGVSKSANDARGPVTSLRPVGPALVPAAASSPPDAAYPVSTNPEFDQLRQERPSLSELIGVVAPNSGYAARRRMTEGQGAERRNGASSRYDDEIDQPADQLVDLTAETIRLIRSSLDR